MTARGRTRRTLERDREALEMRYSGATYPEISKALGVGLATAYDAVHNAIKDTLREPAEKVLDLELGRLDLMLASVWPMAIQGNLAAVEPGPQHQRPPCPVVGLGRRGAHPSGVPGRAQRAGGPCHAGRIGDIGVESVREGSGGGPGVGVG